LLAYGWTATSTSTAPCGSTSVFSDKEPRQFGHRAAAARINSTGPARPLVFSRMEFRIPHDTLRSKRCPARLREWPSGQLLSAQCLVSRTVPPHRSRFVASTHLL